MMAKKTRPRDPQAAFEARMRTFTDAKINERQITEPVVHPKLRKGQVRGAYRGEAWEGPWYPTHTLYGESRTWDGPGTHWVVLDGVTGQWRVATPADWGDPTLRCRECGHIPEGEMPADAGCLNVDCQRHGKDGPLARALCKGTKVKVRTCYRADGVLKGGKA